MVLPLLLVLALAAGASGRVIGAAVIPHGDFAYDPSLVDGKNGSKELHKACLEVGGWLDALSPDVIFLTTPHGMELSEQYLVYQNSKEAGSAVVGGDLHNKSHPGYAVNATVETDTGLAQEVVDRVGGVSGMVGFADSLPLPISWGEILPLSYKRAPSRVVIFSMPLRRYNHSVDMVPDLLRVGRELFMVLEESVHRVAVVISSDLAHTHYFPAAQPYPPCPCAEPFDKAVGRWVSTANRTELVVTATKLQGAGAMSCGFTGLVLLQGLIDNSGGFLQWSPYLLANYHPTYYGMMVARFERRD